MSTADCGHVHSAAGCWHKCRVRGWSWRPDYGGWKLILSFPRTATRKRSEKRLRDIQADGDLFQAVDDAELLWERG